MTRKLIFYQNSFNLTNWTPQIAHSSRQLLGYWNTKFQRKKKNFNFIQLDLTMWIIVEFIGDMNVICLIKFFLYNNSYMWCPRTLAIMYMKNVQKCMRPEFRMNLYTWDLSICWTEMLSKTLEHTFGSLKYLYSLEIVCMCSD